MSSAAALKTENNVFPHLQKQQYMSLTTYRKTGEAVSTPVWFARVDDKLYVYTGAMSGKVKRIRHNPAVTVAPCTMSGTVSGPAQEACARIMGDDEGHIAREAIDRKYGVQMRLLGILDSLASRFRRRASVGPVYLEIAAARMG